MINLGFLLHAYQPWTQLEHIRRRIFYESYWPIISFANSYPGFTFSFDITLSIGEHLPNWFLKYMSDTYSRGKIELLNTSAYHYLLPLHDMATIRRQFRLNEDFYRENFINNDHLPGVFLPELAFSPDIAQNAPLYGFSWCMAEDWSYTYNRLNLPEERRSPLNWIPKCGPAGILVRSSYWSKRIAFGKYSTAEEFLEELIKGQLNWRAETGVNGDSYIILALDMETFGHHQRDGITNFLIPFFKKLLECEKIITVTPINKIFEKFPKVDHTQFFSSASWSTEKEHLDRGIAYPLWRHPTNLFHILWGEFAKRAYSKINQVQNKDAELEKLMDKAFYSCPLWQYSYENKKIAYWCIPAFRRIAELLGNDKTLSQLIQRMEILLKK